MNWRASIIGVTPEYFTIRSWPIASGQYFTDADVRGATKGLRDRSDHRGQSVQRGRPGRFSDQDKKDAVQDRRCALGERAISAGTDQDDIIIAPYTTVQKKMSGQTFLGSILASAVSEER
jgi:putative ABC transport system permease protein